MRDTSFLHWITEPALSARSLGNWGNKMTLLLTFATLAVTVLLMPDVFAGFWQGAVENPVVGIGLLALLALIGVWIDRR